MALLPEEDGTAAESFLCYLDLDMVCGPAADLVQYCPSTALALPHDVDYPSATPVLP